jgi:hypothetical protein
MSLQGTLWVQTITEEEMEEGPRVSLLKIGRTPNSNSFPKYLTLVQNALRSYPIKSIAEFMDNGVPALPKAIHRHSHSKRPSLLLAKKALV